MRLGNRLVLGLTLLLTSMLAFNIQPVWAHSGVVLGPAWTTTAPTIDGVIGTTEWAAADTETFTLPTSGLTGTLYVMNDAVNIYIALRINDPDFTVDDKFRISFENDHDGVLEAGDDSLWYCPSAPWLGFSDDYYQFPLAFDTAFGGTKDGGGAMSRVGGENHIEIWHPLNSADDAHDFSLSLGDTVGFALAYASDGQSLVGNEWPGPLHSCDENAPVTDWGDIVIARPPGPAPEFSFATPIITSVAAVVYLFIRQRMGKRKE